MGSPPADRASCIVAVVEAAAAPSSGGPSPYCWPAFSSTQAVISSISGPIFAAYLIGFLEAFSNYAFGLYWTPAILFAVLIATLMVRPEGLFAPRIGRFA